MASYPIIVRVPGSGGKKPCHLTLTPNPDHPVVIGAPSAPILTATNAWLDGSNIEGDGDIPDNFTVSLPVGITNIGQFHLPVAVARLVAADLLDIDVVGRFRFYGMLDGPNVVAPPVPDIPEGFTSDARRVTIVPPGVEDRFEGIKTAVVDSYESLIGVLFPAAG